MINSNKGFILEIDNKKIENCYLIQNKASFSTTYRKINSPT